MHEDLLQKIKADLKAKGFKLTEPRLRILEYLVKTTEHPGISEVYHVIKDSGIGMATVYRTIDMLVQTGIVKPLLLNDARLRYEINHPGDHHHHLICSACGQVVEFGSCSFHTLVEEIEKVTRFRIQEHTLAAYGFCPQCSTHDKQHKPNAAREDVK